ncbi:MAG: hypothetical protein JWN73_1088 [Betaproteobacteria bacterium]|nr:hypothetical protein [Betaproteobacteria bacterium]
MKTSFLTATALIGLIYAVPAAQAARPAQPTAPSRAAMAVAVAKYLAQHGDFCIGKFNWPIDVPLAEFESTLPTRDTTQMPVLENAGLVASSTATVERREGEEGAQDVKQVPVRRYQLTEAGERYYLKKKMVSAGLAGQPVVHGGDFCAGRLSLDRVVGMEKPVLVDGQAETTVTYTYRINAFPWARDEDLQGVFPMVARVVKGEHSMQLKQRFRHVGNQWVAVQAWEK